MNDLVLNKTLRLTIVGTISALSLTCIILCYQGMLDAIWGNWREAAAKFGWGIGAGTAALMLIRHRDDLIDS